MDVEDAFDQINHLFKPNKYANEIETIRWKSKLSFQFKHYHFIDAHLEVIREIIESIADHDTNKVKKFKGGRFTKIEEKEEGEQAGLTDRQKEEKEDEIRIKPKWIDNGAKPTDLAGLVFNIFLYKINIGLRLDSRSIMSLNGDTIYVVIKADDNDLRRAAEQSEFTMQLAVGLTDLTSLEPCDRFYRPFRK